MILGLNDMNEKGVIKSEEGAVIEHNAGATK